MYIEDAEEDADAESGAGGGLNPFRFFHLAVTGGDDQTRSGRDLAVWITEKYQEKHRKEEWNRRQTDPMRPKINDYCDDQQRNSVIKSIPNHRQRLYLRAP